MVLTREELVSALSDEVRILLHLCGKIEPAMLDYRPTPKQRSTIELLRYLTMMGPAIAQAIKTGQFDVEAWQAGVAAAEKMDFAAVTAALASLDASFRESIAALSDDELRAEIEMFGGKASRGAAYVKWILSGHAAYRTQLFCYLKSCGREELGTSNLWGGMDARP